MTNEERLIAALEYQEAMQPAFGNPNLMRQGRRMNLPARQVPGPVSAFGTQAMSLNPQPDQGYGTMAAEMALGFLPGIGQAMAARDIERARRDNDPLGMALAGTSFVPFGKLIGALRGGKQMGPVSQVDLPDAQTQSVLTNNEILEQFWKDLDKSGDGYIGVRADDAIVKNSFRKSWNRPDQVKTTRLPGTSVIGVGQDNISKEKLLEAIKNVRGYGKNVYLLEGKSPTNIQYLANDPGERLLSDNKILSSFFNESAELPDVYRAGGKGTSNFVLEPSLTYKDPFDEID